MGEFSVPMDAISMHTDGRITVRLQICYWIEHDSPDVAAWRRNPGWSWPGNPYTAALHTGYDDTGML